MQLDSEQESFTSGQIELQDVTNEQGFPPLYTLTGNMFLKTNEKGRGGLLSGGGGGGGGGECKRAFAHSKYSEAIDVKMFGK